MFERTDMDIGASCLITVEAAKRRAGGAAHKSGNLIRRAATAVHKP